MEAELERRIARLEREARLWRIIATVGLALAVSGPAVARTGGGGVLPLLRVRRLEVVDGLGSTIASLGSLKSSGVLALHASDGSSLLLSGETFNFWDKDRSDEGLVLSRDGLALVDKAGNPRVSLKSGGLEILKAGRHGGALLTGNGLDIFDGSFGAASLRSMYGGKGIVVSDGAGKVASLDGNSLRLYDKAKSLLGHMELRAVLGSTSGIYLSTGATITTAPSSLMLFDASGSVLYQLPPDQ